VGGLALLWKETKEVEIQKKSARHINVVITMDDYEIIWKFIRFYRHPERAKQSESWELLKYLKYLSTYLWVCVGDFNEIINQSKKKWSSIME
jgi:hypothetical protein